MRCLQEAEHRLGAIELEFQLCEAFAALDADDAFEVCSPLAAGRGPHCCMRDAPALDALQEDSVTCHN